MANDLKDYWTRRMAEQGKAVDGTPLPATQQPVQTPQAAPTQADTAPASNNPLYNYWSKRMAEQGRTAEGSPLTSNLTAAPGTEANTTPSDIGTIRNWYTGVNTDLTTINNYASSGDYDAELNQEYLAKLRNYNTELDGYIESASSQGYNKDANTMQNTKNGVDALIKQLEDSANSQTRTIDTSIQKTLGSAADYSQEVSDLESQIEELERTNHRGVIRQDTDAVSGELYDVYGNVNDEALHQLREQLQNANANKAAAERSEQRERLRSNPNFEQYSSSITPITENDAAIRALGGKSIDAVSGETVTDQSVKDLLGYATKDEEQLFNYILARQGEDAAAEYLDDLRYDLNARQASEKSQEASQYADEHGVLASGKSVGQNLISGAGWFDTAIQNAYRDITGENRRIDYNTWANQQSQQVQATRQTVAEDLVENHPNFKFDLLGREVNLGDVYQLGMSMLDSGATAALGAATGGGGWTAALLGASAGSQATQQAVRNGASDSEALALGFAAMVAETATEKFSIDGLLEGTGKTWFTNMLKQAGVEASEEAASTVLNTIADDAIRGENSDYNRRIRELEQSGMSHEDASNQAWKELGQQIMFDAIGGAVSGGIMGGMFRGVRSNADTQTQQATETTTEQTEQTASTPLAETVNRANQQTAETASEQTRQYESQRNYAEYKAEQAKKNAYIAELGQSATRESVDNYINELENRGYDVELTSDYEDYQNSYYRVRNKNGEVIDKVPYDGSNYAEIMGRLRLASGDATLPQFEITDEEVEQQRASQYGDDFIPKPASQNSPLEQTSASETNTPLSETVLNATEAQQTASAPTVSENVQNVADKAQNIQISEADFDRVKETTSIDQRPEIHTKEQQNTINEYIASADKNVFNFALKYIQNKAASFKRQLINHVSSRQNTQLKELLGGDFSNYSNILTKDAVLHIWDRHGEAGRHDSTMKNVADISRVGYVLENADKCGLVYDQNGKQRFSSTYRDSNNKSAPLVKFSKKIDNNFYVVEAVADNARKSLWVESMYMEKNKDAVKQAPYTGVSSSAQGITAKPGLANPASTINLSQAEVNVNRNSQNADVTGEAQTESQAWRPDGQGEDVREHSTSERIRERKTVVHDALVEETQADPSYYKVRHNKDTVAAAEAVLFNEDGSEADLNEVASHAETKLSNARNGTGKIRPEDVLISVQAADRLMEHANTLEQSGLTQEAQSEKARADRIMSALYAEQAEAGQLSQAARLISKASPATQRQMRQDYLERCLNDWNSKLTKAQGRKIQVQTGENTIQLPTELSEAYVNAETDADLEQAYSDIVSYVGQNTPSTLYQQITALRFLNMLGNPVTQGRNIIGNTFSFANYFVKRRMQSALESILTPGDKTFAMGVDLNDLRAWMGLTSDPEIAAALENNGRYQDVRSQNRSKFAQDSIDEQTVFGNKALEGYRKLTNKATSGGDIIFLKLNFADAAQAYARAHGFTLETATPEQRAAAVAVATREAQEATFHDDTAISELATKARVDENGEWANRNRVNKATAKIVNALGDGLQPFRKTPANVAVRGEEFSPLGFINTIVKGAVRAHDIKTKGSSNITTSDIINQLSKALTGTGLTVAGAMLRAAGKARTSDDEDKNLNAYEKMNGLQDYAIKINGKWTTADWAAPDSIPFFMGVELYDALNGSGQFNEDDIINVFGALTGTMTEMSMLQGINDTLKGLNSFGGDDNALMKFVTALGTSYLQQLLGNSFLGRIESAATPYRQSTYIDPDSRLSSETQYALGSLGNKIPFWDFQQEDYIDAWGNKVENQNTSNPITRALRSIGSPAYISEEKTTELDQALYDLNAELKELGIETNVFPSRAKRSVDNVQLTPKEYERFATEQGHLSHDLVEEFTKSPYWDTLSAEEKANTINSLYSYAKDRAEQNIRASRGTIEVGKSDNDKIAAALDNNAEDIAGYLALKGSFSDRESTGDYAGLDSLLATVNTAKNGDGTYSDPEVQQMATDKDFARYLSAYANGTSSKLVGSVLDNIEAVNNLLPDADSADEGEKMRIVFETLSRAGADVQDYKNILDTYKTSSVSQAKVNWLVKNYFPDDVETQEELYNVFRDYKLTKGQWKTPFERQKDATEPENLMP